MPDIYLGPQAASPNDILLQNTTALRMISSDTLPALTEGLLLDLLLQPIISDSTTVTELVQLPFYIILGDATTATDASTVLLPILLVNINQESTLVMTDVPTVNWVLSMNMNDATAVSELQTVLLPFLVPSVNDATGVTEFSLVYWPLTITDPSETTGISDLMLIVMNPLSPLFLLLSESVPVNEFSITLLPILNCAVNEVIITDDAAPPTLQIGGHGREYSPALVTDVDSIT